MGPVTSAFRPSGVHPEGNGEKSHSLLDKKISVFSFDYISSWASYIDKFPNNRLQTALDDLGKDIQTNIFNLLGCMGVLGPLPSVRSAKGLQATLMALPRNAIKDIFENIGVLIQAIAKGLVHPYEGAKTLLFLIRQISAKLSQPMTYACLGAGLLGTLTSQTLLGNPFSAWLLLMGSSCIISGVSLDLHGRNMALNEDLSEETFWSYFNRDTLALTEIFLKVVIATLLPSVWLKCAFSYVNLSVNQMEQVQTTLFRMALGISQLDQIL